MKLIKLLEQEENGAWYEDEYGAEVWVPKKPLDFLKKPVIL